MKCPEDRKIEQVSVRTQKLIKDMKPRQHTQSLTSLVKDVDEDDMLVYLYGCAKHGQWLKWWLNLSCKSIHHVRSCCMYGHSSPALELLSIHFNAVMTNCHLLQIWDYVKTNLGSCQFCHNNSCTLFHILNGCNYSLQSGRYNWRHDQTLKTTTSGLMPS